MNSKILIVIFLFCFNIAKSQTEENFSDRLLASTFKLFQEADLEFAHYMLPFLTERFVQEISDTSNFANPYDSLSKYIDIRYTTDSLLKSYCWSERSGSCCHSSAIYIQYRTDSGDVLYEDLQGDNKSGQDYFIIDLQSIEIYNIPHYLILGWGTCCGAKHYSIARVYKIQNESLVQCDSVFGKESELYIGANRDQKMEMSYSHEQQILSFNRYEFDSSIGFYKKGKDIEKWKLTRRGFKKIN